MSLYHQGLRWNKLKVYCLMVTNNHIIWPWLEFSNFLIWIWRSHKYPWMGSSLQRSSYSRLLDVSCSSVLHSSYSMIVKWLFSSAKWDFCFVSCPHLSLSVCRVLRVASTYLGTNILLSSWHWLLIIGWKLSFGWNIWEKYLFVFVLTSPIMFTLKVFLFKTQQTKLLMKWSKKLLNWSLSHNIFKQFQNVKVWRQKFVSWCFVNKKCQNLPNCYS